MRKLALCAAFMLLPLLAVAQSNSPDPKAAAVRAVLDAQLAAWNRGDLEGYMEGYWRSPDLEFYSGDTITLGWQQTLDRYRKRYQGEGKDMGHLDFSGLQVHTNPWNVVWVAGRWHLKMKDGTGKGGLFTLIFHKFPAGWKIIHDHTS
jgi:ketosteroid isomerase-like protein